VEQPDLWCTVLGPVRAWRTDVEVDLGPPQQRAVFGLLLLYADRFMAARAGSHLTETAGSHATPVSQPSAVADTILTAAHVVS